MNVLVAHNLNILTSGAEVPGSKPGIAHNFLYEIGIRFFSSFLFLFSVSKCPFWGLFFKFLLTQRAYFPSLTFLDVK